MMPVVYAGVIMEAAQMNVVCPMVTVWELHQALPDSGFHVIQGAGHSMTEDGIRSKLIELTDML